MREYALNINMQKYAIFPELGHIWTPSGGPIGKAFQAILGHFSQSHQPQSALRSIFDHFKTFWGHFGPSLTTFWPF